MRIGLQLRRVAQHRPVAVVVFKKMRDRRRDSSSETCSMVSSVPEPVGHSTLKSSP